MSDRIGAVGRGARGWGRWAGVAFLVGLLAVAVPPGAAGAGPGPSPSSSGSPAVPLRAHPAVEQTLSGTYTAITEGSVGVRSLSSLELSNLSYELLLFDAATNRSSVVAVSSPAATIEPGSIQGAGGRFFVCVWNTTTLRELFLEVTTSGTYSVVSLPLGATADWSFVYGNATALFGAVRGDLVEIDPATRTLVKNYSASIPAGLAINDLLPVGHFLYLAGGIANATGATSAYFGRLNLSSATTSRISGLRYYRTPYFGAFFSLGRRGDNVWVGGGVVEDLVAITAPYVVLATLDGLLFSYNASTGALANRSGLLAGAATALPWAIVPWGGTLLLNVERYNFTSSSSATYGWLFALGSSGHALANVTSLAPTGFIAGYFEITSETGGYVFLSGATAGGVGQVVAIKA